MEITNRRHSGKTGVVGGGIEKRGLGQVKVKDACEMVDVVTWEGPG